MLLASSFSYILSSCDPLHTSKCEWYLEPEPNFADTVEKGWVSICARNFVINKQKCQFKIQIEKAEKIIGKPITLDSLVYDKKNFPREIKSFRLCKPR